MEDDARHGTAMPHQCVLLRGPWYPLPGAATLTVRSARVELSFRLRELGFKVHHLSHGMLFTICIRFSIKIIVNVRNNNYVESAKYCICLSIYFIM